MPAIPVEAAPDYADYLELFSASALKKIAQALGVAPAAGANGYVDAIADFLGTPRHLQVLADRLPDDLWSLLTLLPVRAGPFRPRVLIVALEQRGLSATDALAKVTRLLSHGCVLPAGGIPGTQRLGLDSTSLRNWLPSLQVVVPRAILTAAAERQPESHRLPAVAAPNPVVPPELEALQRAVYIVLAEAAAKPIRLTQRGAPYKTEVTRLALALAGPTATSTRGPKRKAPAAVPPVLGFALAALSGARLLEERDQELHPSSDVDQFLAAPIADQVRRLAIGWRFGPYNDFIRIPTLSSPSFGAASSAEPIAWYVNDDWNGGTPNLTKLIWSRSLIWTALTISASPDADAWHRIVDVAEEIYRDDPDMLFDLHSDYELLYSRANPTQPGESARIAPYFGISRVVDGSAGGPIPLFHGQDWLEVEGAYVRQVIGESLRWLGLVDVGPDPTRPELFHLTDLGRHVLLEHPLVPSETTGAVQVIVQPNYDVVVVDALANAPLLAQLNDFAERRSFDRAATYRLTQDALLRGLQRGWTGARVLETLERVNQGPIPQNVRFTIQEWIQRFESLSVREQATIVEADDPEQLDGWLADRTLAAQLGPRLGPTTVLVPSPHATAVARRVAQMSKRVELVDYSKPRTGILQVVEPDLIEVLKIEPYLDYQLRSFSVPVIQPAEISTYRIDAASVAAAREAGRDGRDLIEFLARTSGGPLPPDFYVRLLGWSGETTPATQETLVVVHLDDELIDWDVITSIPAITPHVRAILTPSLALVDPGNLDALRAELAMRGLTLKAGVLPSPALEPEIDPLASLGDADLMRAALSRIIGGSSNLPDAFGGYGSPWPPRRR